MATTFPSAIDAFVNPLPNQLLSSPSHSGQHSDVNDAITAVERVVVGPVWRNLREFGATGSGAGDDSAAINAAISSGARYIVGVPGDNYRITSALALNQTNQTLDFNGATITPVGAINALTITGSSLTVRNLVINGAGCTARCIYTPSALQKLHLDNVIINNPFKGIEFIDIFTSWLNRVQVIGATERAFIAYSTTAGTPINSLWLTNCAFNDSVYAGEVTSVLAATGVWFSNCSFQGNDGAASDDVRIDASTAAGVNTVVLDNCYFEHGSTRTGNCVNIGGSASGNSLRDIRISRSVFQTSKQIINIGAAALSDITIDQCQSIAVTGNPPFSVVVGGGSPLPQVVNCSGSVSWALEGGPGIRINGGASLLSGSSAPTTSFGIKGDFYFRTGSTVANAMVYCKTSASSWTGIA